MRKKGNTVWVLTTLFLTVMMIANVAAYAENDVFRSVEERVSESVQVVYNEEALKSTGIQVVVDENFVITRDGSVEIIIPTQVEMIDVYGKFPDNHLVSDKQDEINWDPFSSEYKEREHKAEIVIMSIEARQHDMDFGASDYIARQFDAAISDDLELTEDNGMTSSPPRSLPDLAITSLNVTQYANSALQALAPTTVTFGLSNYGPVSASNVQVGLYENNSLMGIVNFGTIPGNSSWTATINVSGGIGGFIHGSNLITVTADPKNLISESNKNNNSFSRYYLFFGAPNLQVVSIVIFPFIGTFTTMQSLPYGFNIRNDGNAPSANNSPGSLRINGDLFLSFSMPILNPGDSITGTLSITYLKSNTYNVLVQTSMHSRSMNTFVNYDVEVLAGRWQNASNLSVQAFSSITNSVNNWDNLRTYLQWNFHSNNVNFQPFQTHPNNISLGADFEMTGQALSGNQVGVTYLYKSGPSGLVPILYPYTDSSPFARADIRIKTGIIPSILTRTVVHEFGHGLGLDHPVCGDEALMRQDTDPLHAKNITFHDCHNLQSKYGN